MQVVDFFGSYRLEEGTADKENVVSFLHENPEQDFELELETVETEISITAKVRRILRERFPKEDFIVNLKDWRLLVERWREAWREDTKEDLEGWRALA